ncbi:TatD family hydrolase [Modestobacter sp. VKM Ac-2985]|nr:TatD family hydrolase [Modestobacter sp. VKM Ac-2985]MCZ2836774.1 TatD family hydrolase [Modestobacter sp. VKM Ac-2985]
MTRSLQEARQVVQRQDRPLTWGLGVHPGLPAALEEYSAETFRRAHPYFAVVGEVGMDRRGSIKTQQAVFESILDELQDQPVLISVHSTGRIDPVLDAIEKRPHPGLILHWFSGNPDQVERAAGAGCYFSVNAAMTDEALERIPEDRWLPETDFPSSRARTKARLPGNTYPLEDRISHIRAMTPPVVRQRAYRNLRDISTKSGAVARLPKRIADLLATLPVH